MGLRLDLHEILVGLTPNVYFQPPNNVVMQYPCIVYVRNRSDTNFADNTVYHDCLRYQVTVIDPNPDGDIRDKVKTLPLTLYQRFFVADNLNHDVFFVYF